MRKTTLITLLLLSAAATTPAAANWFSRPDVGITLNVGSAPNPTPYDLRAIGDSRYAAVYPRERFSLDALREMAGKPVYGKSGEELGYVLTVDENARLVQVQLPTGVAIAVEAQLLINEPDRVVAPTLSHDDVLAMAQAQTGRRTALLETRP